jgi:hypothetical protein
MAYSFRSAFIRRVIPDFGAMPTYARNYLRVLLAEYDGLPKRDGYDEPADIKVFRAQTDDRLWTWADLVVIENGVLNATQDGDLRATTVRGRERYRDVVGDSRFAFYMQSGPPDPKTASATDLRADIRALAARIHYLLATIAARETMRNRLSLLLGVVMIAAGLIAFGSAVVWEHGRPSVDFACLMGDHGCSLLQPGQFVAFAGLFGGFVSVQQRLQSGGYVDPFFKRIEMSSGWASIVLIAPLMGAIFAIVLFWIFMTGAISGDAFPHFIPDHMADSTFRGFMEGGTPSSAQEWAKLGVWGFIAGFAERLVPDALTRLSTVKNLVPDSKS